MPEITNTNSPLAPDAPARATRISFLEHLRARFVVGRDMYPYYVRAREADATHAEVLEAHANGIDVFFYARAREADATHAEVLEVHAKGIHVGTYAFARRDAGATHAEVLDTHAKGVNIYMYAYARWHGGDMSHEEVLELFLKGILHSNASHSEFVKALASVDRGDRET